VVRRSDREFQKGLQFIGSHWTIREVPDGTASTDDVEDAVGHGFFTPDDGFAGFRFMWEG
jgi:hypothetical protein